VPTGGTTGQHLIKNSNANYDFAWGTPSGGGLTWPLLAPDGTSAAPSYSFSNAPSTGLYSGGGVTSGPVLAHTVPSTALTSGAGLTVRLSTQDAAYTTPNVYALYIPTPTLGPSMSMGNVYGVYLGDFNYPSSQNNFAYALYISAQTSGGRGLYCAVGADAYFNDNVSITGAVSSSVSYGVLINRTFNLSGPAAISVSAGLAAGRASTNAYGIQLLAWGTGAGATITNLYGLNVANQGKAAVTNAYGIYINAQANATTTNIGLYNAGTTTLVGAVTAQAGVNVTGGALTGSGAVPTGGAAGQVLSKIDATNYNLQWITPGGGVTWPLLAPDGAFNAPSYSFVNSQTTGLFRDGSDSIGFSTNGLSRWRINASGHFVAPADNTYDIGQSGTTRPRDLFLGRNLTVGGVTQHNGAVGVGGGADSRAVINWTQSSGQYMSDSGNNWYLKLDAWPGPNLTSGGELIALRFFCGLDKPVNNVIGIRVLPFSKSGSGAANNLYGIYVESQGLVTSGTVYGLRVDGPNSVAANYGIYIQAPSNGTTNIGLYNGGTSQLQGNVGIGAAPSSWALLTVSGGTSGVAQYGIQTIFTPTSAATSQALAVIAQVQTPAVTFTIGQVAALFAQGPVVGAGTSITTSYGLYVGPQGSSAVTTAYGAYVSAQSGATTNNVGIYAAQNSSALLIGGSGTLPTNSAGAGIAFYAATGAKISFYDNGGGTFFGLGINPSEFTVCMPATFAFRLNGMSGTVLASLTTAGALTLANNLTVTAGNVYLVNATTTVTSDGTNLLFFATGGAVFTRASAIYSQNNSGTYMPVYASVFSVQSARKAKTDIQLLSDPLSLVTDPRVHAVRYTERDTGKASLGFVADDWLPVLPEVVALDELGDVLALDYDRISAVTFEALKQYIVRTEARLAALENAA